MPRRTDKQCRERYANVLDPELRLYAEWTPEEDKLLLRAVKEQTKPNGKIKCGLQTPLRNLVFLFTTVPSKHLTHSAR